MKKLLLLILLALGLSAEAQQTCFGSSCSSSGTATVTGATIAGAVTCTDSVGTDAYACSPTTCTSTLDATTPPVLVDVATANTGAATFAFCGAAAKAIVRTSGSSVSTALVTGDVLARQILLLKYSVTNDNWQMGSVSSIKPTTPATLNDATYCPDVGASDAYVCSMVSAPVAYAAGMLVTLSANTANTGTASVNVNALGVKTITRADGSTLVTGDIVATQPSLLEYDGTNFRMISQFGLGPYRYLNATTTYHELSSAVPLNILGNYIVATVPPYGFSPWGSGGGITEPVITWSSVNTPDTPVFDMGNTSQSWHFRLRANYNYDYQNSCLTGLGTAACTDPTLILHSATQSTTQALSLGHNQTQGVITANGGVLARSLTYASGSDVGFTVQGSLSGNMQNWKNSAGTTLTHITSAGNLSFDVNGTQGITSFGGAGIDFYNAGAIGINSGNIYGQVTTFSSATKYQARITGHGGPLTPSTATTITTVTLNTGSAAGGVIEYVIEAEHGGDFQARSGSVNFAIANKAGTTTCGINATNETDDRSVIAASAGTLTYALTFVSSGGTCLLKVNAVTSLSGTPTVLRWSGTHIRGNCESNGGSCTTFTY